MNTDNSPRRSGRLQLVLVALIFAVPLIAASWLYFSDSDVRPIGRTNNGTLLDPIVNMADDLGDTALLARAENRWMLVYLPSGECAADCEDALYKQRQMRLMLGNDMSRVVRVLLHGPEAPDTLPDEQDDGGLVAVYDSAARQLLSNLHPQGRSADGFFLVDPLGNLVMFFPADITPRELVDDVEHLLKLSHIG